MEIVIKAHRHWWQLDLSEIWSYRELLLTLIGRDIKVRYKQTLLGVVWVILQPLLAAGIFALIFSSLLGGDLVDGVHYGAFVLCGFTFWQFFSTSVTTASSSVVDQMDIVKKIYFPRVYFPMTVVGRCLFDFLITFVCFIIILLAIGTNFTLIGVGWSLLNLFILIFLALGLSLFFSALNVQFRDVKHILPFLMQIWLYVSPVFYSDSILPQSLSFFTILNPLAVVLNLIRQGLFNNVYNWPTYLFTLLISLAVLYLGLIFFKNTERKFSDIA